MQIDRGHLSSTAFSDIVNQVRKDQGTNSDHHVRLRSDNQTLYVRDKAGLGRNFLTGVKDLFVGHSRRQEGLNVIRSAIAAEYKLNDAQLEKLFSNISGGVKAHQLEGLQQQAREMHDQLPASGGNAKSEKATGPRVPDEKALKQQRIAAEGFVKMTILRSRCSHLNDAISTALRDKAIRDSEFKMEFKNFVFEDILHSGVGELVKNPILAYVTDKFAAHMASLEKKDAAAFMKNQKGLEEFVSHQAQAYVYEQAGVPMPEKKAASATAAWTPIPKLSGAAFQAFSDASEGPRKTNAALHYLGLNEGAGKAEVDKAYRAAALLMHPDKGGTAEGFQQLGAIRDHLRDVGL
jgi:hypothetical protein